MKNFEVLHLFKTLEEIKSENIGNLKFKISILQNINKIENDYKLFTEKEQEVYKEAREEFQKRQQENPEQDQKELEQSIMSEFTPTIDRKTKEFNQFMLEEYNNMFRPIKIEQTNIPDNIKTTQLEILQKTYIINLEN